MIYKIIINNTGNVRFVGGCVRDYLNGNKPYDFNLATNLDPKNILKILKKRNYNVIFFNMKHGTVIIVINNKNYEITSLRKDLTHNGRFASSKLTNNWYEDSI